MEKYLIEFNSENYINGWSLVEDGDEYNYEGHLDFSMDITEGWYKLVNNNFVVDEQKKAEIIAEREKEAQKPTWEETIDAQVTYTAMMTDTILEE